LEIWPLLKKSVGAATHEGHQSYTDNRH